MSLWCRPLGSQRSLPVDGPLPLLDVPQAPRVAVRLERRRRPGEVPLAGGTGLRRRIPLVARIRTRLLPSLRLTAVSGKASAALKEGVVQGSCLCGDVAFEFDEVPTKMVNCHCSRCRISRGAAHGTNVFSKAEKLRWVRGAERVKTYKVPGAVMYGTAFCERCGSKLPALFEKSGRYLVPVGVLDTVLRSSRASTFTSARRPRGSISPTRCRSSKQCRRASGLANSSTDQKRTWSCAIAPRSIGARLTDALPSSPRNASFTNEAMKFPSAMLNNVSDG